MKRLIIALLLVGCETPEREESFAKGRFCTAENMELMQEYVSQCDEAGYFDFTCFRMAVEMYCDTLIQKEGARDEYNVR